MSGYQAVLQMRRLEQEANQLGFMFSHPKSRWSSDSIDQVALKPLNDEAVPVYSRDAEVFVGTLDQLGVWLRGVEWARNYDMLLRVSDEKKRHTKENQVRAHQAEQRKREEQKKMLAVLRATDQENITPKK